MITKSEVSTGEKAVVATAINVTDYDSKANVNINGNVSSKDGSLSVNAENVLTDNTVIANNAMGSSAFMKKIVTNIKGFCVLIYAVIILLRNKDTPIFLNT